MTLTSTLRSRISARGLTAAALCSVVVLAICGCTAGGNKPAAAPPTKGATNASTATVVWNGPGAISTIDPAQASYNQTNYVDEMLYDTLLTYNGDHELVPSLASAYAYSSDVTSLTMTLHSGVTFHDGTPLTAHDVAYTLDRDVKIPGISSLLSSYKSTKVESDTKLTIELKAPDALFAGALSKVYILNSKLVAEHAGSDYGQQWLGSHDAGSGPYTLTSFVSSRVAFQRYAKYWKFEPSRPKTFVQSQVDQPSTEADNLISGAASIAGINGQDQARVKKAGIKTISTGGSITGIFFNTHVGPTANVKVREAVSLAYDYQGSLAKISDGLGQIPDGPLPTFLQCRPQLPQVKQDLAKAKQILQQAGLQHLTLTLRIQPAFPDQVQMATLLQSNLKSIGVTLKLVPITYPAYQTVLRDWNKIPEMMLLGENLPYPDTGVELQQVYNSKSVGTNKGAYKNPKVDALLNEANTTPSATKRCDLYRSAQQIIATDHVVMPMVYGVGILAYSSNLTNITLPDPSAGPALQNITVS